MVKGLRFACKINGERFMVCLRLEGSACFFRVLKQMEETGFIDLLPLPLLNL